MPKGKGAECPHCGKQTFHDNGSLSTCSYCNTVGWSWQKAVMEVGKGKGNKCPNCKNQTLHRVGEATSPKRKYVHPIRRCKTCDYSLIEPTEQQGTD